MELEGKIEIAEPANADEVRRVFGPKILTGRLVIIGPTSRENGTPNEVDELPETAAMWIGWVPTHAITETLTELQAGNHETLAIYAMAKATLEEVNELKRILGVSGNKLRGSWFRVWTPLAYIIRTLRGGDD